MLSPSDISTFVKDALTVFKKAERVELSKALIDLQQENNEMREELNRLREQLRFGASLIFENNAYYSTSQGKEKIGPYCSRCLDTDHSPVRMHTSSDGFYFKCPACKSTIHSPSHPGDKPITLMR